MYNALSCKMCTRIFGTIFQEKKILHLNFFNSFIYLYLETKLIIVLQDIILHIDITIAFWS